MSEQKQQTLVEKLEQERNAKSRLADYYKTVALEHLVHGLDAAIDIVKQHSHEVCNWRDNRGTGLWECHYGGDYTSDCGLEWNMSNKDSPSENGIHFCPKCGRKLVEIKLSVEMQEKIYEQEMDKIKFCGCGCILPDGSDQCSDCEVQE